MDFRKKDISLYDINRLVLCNRDGECLLCDTLSVIKNGHILSLKVNLTVSLLLVRSKISQTPI